MYIRESAISCTQNKHIEHTKVHADATLWSLQPRASTTIHPEHSGSSFPNSITKETYLNQDICVTDKLLRSLDRELES